MELYAGVPDLNDFLSTTGGFYVAVNNNSAQIMPYDYTGNIIGVGSETYFGIQRHVYVKQAYPYSSCADASSVNEITIGSHEVLKATFDNDRYYLYNRCSDICTQKYFIIPQCDCQDPSKTIYQNRTTICSTRSQLACVSTLKKNLNIKDIMETCNGICPSRCKTYSFIPTLSSASYPTMYYAKRLKQFPLIKSKVDQI